MTQSLGVSFFPRRCLGLKSCGPSDAQLIQAKKNQSQVVATQQKTIRICPNPLSFRQVDVFPDRVLGKRLRFLSVNGRRWGLIDFRDSGIRLF
jgi:hypothetical protein